MITHFLGREQVAAYCLDFANRLAGLDQNMPKVWCAIGKSGLVIQTHILRLLPEHLQAGIILQPLSYDKVKETVSVVPQSGESIEDAEQELRRILTEDPNALVLDSTVHSGASMVNAIKFLQRAGATNCQTYALVIKRSSGLIPHYFGLVVGDHDRVLFLLEEIPNNRLAKPKATLPGLLRRITEEDASCQDTLDTGVPSISKISWGDLWYDANADGFQVYVVEANNKLLGYVKYKVEPSAKRLALDTIAVDKNLQGKGLGGALFRWTETVARASSCMAIELWGVKEQVESYEKAGYKPSGKWIDIGSGERYQFMSKPLLYHFDLNELSTA